MHRTLTRIVPHLDFIESAAPSFLYTSGRPNRCNPAGASCLYFSETEGTALQEYRSGWKGTLGEDQPKLIYRARVRLAAIIDLARRDALVALGLTAEQLSESWRLRPTPTRLQLVGFAISRQRGISALRYPSIATDRSRKPGWNVAMFPESLRATDRVEILGRSGEALEVLPRASRAERDAAL